MLKFKAIEAQLKKLGFVFIAGIDEVGRGPLAGPVVSAAVILKEKARLPGLKDSKKLSKEKREEFFEKIIKNSVAHSITFISHLVIDEINILNAIRLANKLCVENLEQKPDICIIDGRDKQILDGEFLTFIKGDQHIKSIAAASILAKVARDRLMEEYEKTFPEYDFKSHKGYGTRKHISNLQKYGFCEIHRKSYNLALQEI